MAYIALFSHLKLRTNYTMPKNGKIFIDDRSWPFVKA
jgi:hypothetical protein